MRSPIGWYGGKFNLSSLIAKLLPEHTHYIEVFGGAGHVLFAKQPSPIETYNDLESLVVRFFRVIRDDFDTLQRLLETTPYARDEWQLCRKSLWEQGISDAELARRFFVVVRQSFGSVVSSDTWAVSQNTVRRGMSSKVSSYLSAIELLPEVLERLRTVQIENMSYKRLIPKYDSPESCFYCDPPYMTHTRVTQNQYTKEMDVSEHIDLLNMLKGVKGKVLLSGYHSSIYDDLLKDWYTMDINVKVGIAYTEYGKDLSKSDRVEVLWANYPLPEVGLDG